MEIPENFFNARYTFTNADVVDPMGFSLGGQGDIGMDATEIADACADVFITNFLFATSQLLLGWVFTGVSVTKTAAGEPTIGEDLDAVVGSNPASGAVAHTAVLIKKNTGTGGRQHRGRMFWPPFNLTEANVGVGGAILSTFLTAQQTQLNAWHADLVTFLVPPWLLHANLRDPDTGLEIPDSAATPTPITSFTIQSRAATQRRRIR